jgi:hypothetical protein
MRNSKNLNDLKKKMFEEILKKKYNWLIFKMKKRNIRGDRAVEIIHEAIINFYTYHFNYFNFDKYPLIDITTNEGLLKIKEKANTYFLCCVFRFLAKESFYYLKFKTTLQHEREEELSYSFNNEVVDNLMYGGRQAIDGRNLHHSDDELGENSTGSTKIDKMLQLNRNNVQNFLDVEERMYIKQLSKYVKKVFMKEKTKNMILKYLDTLDLNVFDGFNITYYKEKIKNVIIDFNNLTRENVASNY